MTDEEWAREYCRKHELRYLSHETYVTMESHSVWIVVEDYTGRYEIRLPRQSAVINKSGLFAARQRGNKFGRWVMSEIVEAENERLRDQNQGLKIALEHAIDHLVRLDAFVDGQGYRPSVRGTVALGRAALSHKRTEDRT